MNYSEHETADDWRLVSDSTQRSLRSADVSTCVVPRTLSSYGGRTFAAAGPCLSFYCPVFPVLHFQRSLLQQRVAIIYEIIFVLCLLVSNVVHNMLHACVLSVCLSVSASSSNVYKL